MNAGNGDNVRSERKSELVLPDFFKPVMPKTSRKRPDLV